MPPPPKDINGDREVFTKDPVEKHMTFKQKVDHILKMIPEGLTPEQITTLERLGPLSVQEFHEVSDKYKLPVPGFDERFLRFR